ncbi:MAG: hypothetical protein PHU85_19150, partial [Phycisphaerae bacterium]|nr:hypothetical protein [Phycisphaerae bacterium]
MVFENKCGLAGAGGEGLAAPSHTTAAKLGVVYSADAPRSENRDKSAGRGDDGRVSSLEYARQSRFLADGQANRTTYLDYHHPLEDWLGRRPVRWLLR